MGTDKRARQKANRAMKQQELHRQQKSESMKRTGLRVGIGVVAAIVAVVVIAWIGGAFDDDGEETLTEVSTALSSPSDTATDAFGTEPTDPDTTDPASTDPASTDPGGAAPGSTQPAETVECPPEDGSAEQRREFPSPPPTCIDPDTTYLAEVVTNQGTFTIELDATRAPVTVNNFVFLARYRYFDDTVCHRIIPGFVVQCGDPTATGSGGPGYEFEDELPEAGEYQIGSVAMANSGADTNGSQFFIISGDDGTQLPPNYSLFGQVTDGLDETIPALDALGNPDPAANGVPPLEEVRIESVTISTAG